MHRVCATYVNFVLFFIDRVPINATIVNEVAHTVISDEAESPVGTRADHHYRHGSSSSSWGSHLLNQTVQITSR
jgi:hypothetical protein